MSMRQLACAAILLIASVVVASAASLQVDGGALTVFVLPVEGLHPEPAEPGYRGCSHGFWKQPHHFELWPGEYHPDKLLGSFSKEDGSPLTFREGLELQGGGLNALIRNAIAALLNARHADIAYPWDEAEVMEKLLQALSSGDYERLKDEFELANKRGCELGRNE